VLKIFSILREKKKKNQITLLHYYNREREREINWHILDVFNEDIKCSNLNSLVVILELSRERERNN